MPELPEVETVKRGLQAIYLNKTIQDVEVLYPKILANIEKDEFVKVLKNQKIIDFSRKGKYLIIILNKGYLIIHLRMEGKFKFDLSLKDKHSHIIFTFKDNSVLIYHDVRKFGRMWYFDKDVDIYNVEPLCNLGLEPSEIKDPHYLLNHFSKIHKPIKSVLLDQSIIAGLGNIYADEVCYACYINPLTKANILNLKNCQDIIDNAKEILNQAILDGGSTIKSFQSSHGVDGRFQLKIKVYGKENCPCERCQTLIIKTFVNKRGTHYCPNCQKG